MRISRPGPQMRRGRALAARLTTRERQQRAPAKSRVARSILLVCPTRI